MQHYRHHILHLSLSWCTRIWRHLLIRPRFRKRILKASTTSCFPKWGKRQLLRCKMGFLVRWGFGWLLGEVLVDFFLFTEQCSFTYLCLKLFCISRKQAALIMWIILCFRKNFRMIANTFFSISKKCLSFYWVLISVSLCAVGEHFTSSMLHTPLKVSWEFSFPSTFR